MFICFQFLLNKIMSFVTIYSRDYKNPPYSKVPPIIHELRFFTRPDEKKLFHEKLDKHKALDEEALKSIALLYRNRNRSIYEVDYTKKKLQSLDESNDELMTYLAELYSTPTKKVLPPLPTSRNVFGYMNSRYYYTGISEFQNSIGRLGYDIIRANEERTGIKRLSQKKF